MGEPRENIEHVRLLLAWASAALVVIGLCALAVFGAVIGYGRLYEGRVFPGVAVAGVRLDGLTRTEARKAVQDKIDITLSKGLHFDLNGKDIALDVNSTASDPDASRDLVRYEIDQAIDQAYLVGRGPGTLRNVLEQMAARVNVHDVPPKVFVDRAGIEDALADALKKDLVPVRDAALDIRPSDPPQISIRPEREGVVLVAEPAIDQLERQAASLDLHTISLSERRVGPNVTVKDIEPLRAKALGFLDRPVPSFVYGTSRVRPTASMLASWASVTGTDGAWDIGIDADTFKIGIQQLAKDIERPSKNGSLVVKDGKVISFVPGTEGRAVDISAQYAQFASSWPASTTFPLLVRKTQGTLLGEDPEHLGIKELIGVGRSNFSGSPVNRRKNIAHGVTRVDGTIIPPGAEFSMLKTLGVIDEENGWLPELVIKGNKTEPEFGGGLCQIGTTAFRGALSSGLPITMRQNHSYRVRYYEPAGTDATIYDPQPDFRFKNDTPGSILISAHTEKDDVIFEFWGSKDGRVATSTFPKISNIVEPPPMKLVETLELPPGKKKCTETAHAGATAEFTYTVTFADGTQKQKTFHSFYRPWQAVCLIGVEKLSNPESATGTEGLPPVPEG